MNFDVMMSFRADTPGGRTCWLALGATGLWLVTVVPAHYCFGLSGVEAVTVSAACCLAAGWLTFWLTARLLQPRMQVFGVLLGTGIRGLFALLAAFVMQMVLGLPYQNYLIWLGLFYLATLALETALMVGRTAGRRVS